MAKDTTPNSILLSEVMEILREEKEIPEISVEATVRLILAAQVKFYKMLYVLDKHVEQHDKAIEVLQEDKERRDKLTIGLVVLSAGIVADIILRVTGVF